MMDSGAYGGGGGMRVSGNVLSSEIMNAKVRKATRVEGGRFFGQGSWLWLLPLLVVNHPSRDSIACHALGQWFPQTLYLESLRSFLQGHLGFLHYKFSNAQLFSAIPTFPLQYIAQEK